MARGFVIYDTDLTKVKPRKTRHMSPTIDGFSPETDLVDRRLFFNVTGIRIRDDEFRDSSSGSD